MKKIIIFVISALLLSVFTGCNKDESSSAPVLPQYSTEISSNSTSEQDTPDEVKTEGGFYPIESNKPVNYDVDDADKIYDNTFEGFSGINITSETPRLGNNQQNLGNSYACPGIVCNDGNTVYYTALGYDDFLHRKKDGKDEVFLEKTVWGINIINGQMYCLMNTEKPVQNMPLFDCGDIYRVDIKTGEMSLVLATRAYSLAALEDGLCFIYSNNFGAIYNDRVYQCDLNGENIKARDGAFLNFIGEYYVGFDEFAQNSCFINSLSGEKIRFADRNNLFFFAFDDGYLYYQGGGSSLYRMDPASGETIPMMSDKSYNTISYKTSEIHTETFTMEAHHIGGHYILDGRSYLVDQEFAFRVSPDGTTEIFHTPLETGEGWFYMGMFYDNEKLYTVKYSLRFNQYKLVELQFTDEEFVEGIKTVKEIELL